MKKIIIIGASSGIGKELARMYAKEGFKVGITGRRENLLEELKQESPQHYFIKVLDTKDSSLLAERLDALVSETGGMDICIISSGTGDLNDDLNFSVEKNTIDTNVTGFTCAADWAYNYFVKRKSGHLAVISSVGGLRGSRQAPAYNASKSYQINYLEGLRQKSAFLKLPVFVTDLRPGFVKTDMAKGEGQFWVADVNKAAENIITAIGKKKKVVYITRRWRLIGILLKILPGFIYEKL